MAKVFAIIASNGDPRLFLSEEEANREALQRVGSKFVALDGVTASVLEAVDPKKKGKKAVDLPAEIEKLKRENEELKRKAGK